MTQPLKIDIRTRFIGSDQRCYILFPGNGYRLYEDIKKNSAIFLDLPGFPLFENEDLSKVKNILQRTVMSERIKAWHDGGKEDELPARDLQSLGRLRQTPARLQFAGMVRGFLNNIKEGDVFVVPCQEYENNVLFGEVISTEPELLEIDRYDQDYVPCYFVKWQASIQRAKIPSWLERKIPSPNPLRQIEKEFHPFIFDIMYERYFLDGNFVCKFNVTTHNFSSLDNYLFQQIILYVSALFANNQDDGVRDLSKISLSELASSIQNNDDIPELRIEINSPGHIVVYTKNLIPLVAGALMTLASTVGPTLANDLSTAKLQVQVVNSADNSKPSKECVADIEQEIEDDMEAMGYKRWQELCEVEVRARQRTNVNPGMGIVKP